MTSTAAPRRKPWLPRALIVLVVAAVLGALWASGLTSYLEPKMLVAHRQDLANWVEANGLLAGGAFVLVYILAVSFSLPGATILTIAGGFLFGTVLGGVLVVTGATIGATAVFLVARFVCRDWVEARAGGAVARMEAMFRDNAWSGMLFLRLVPVFPFWLVNLVPAALGVSTLVYVVTTFIGIIPGSVVYVSVGNGLEMLLAKGGTIDLALIFSAEIILPLLGLAALSLLPIAIKAIRRRETTGGQDE